MDEVLTAQGLHDSFETGFTGYPEGRFHFKAYVKALPVSSIPESIVPADPMASCTALRQALSYAAKQPIPEERLAAYKRLIEHQVEAQLGFEESLIDAVMTRCAEGKDMISNYKRYISAVTAQDIQSILSALYDGARVEYIRL